MMALLKRLRPWGIVGQIGWVLVAALLIVHVLIAVLVLVLGIHKPVPRSAVAAVARVSMAIQLLDKQSPDQRRAMVATLADDSVAVSANPNEASVPSAGMIPDDSLADLIRVEIGPPARSVIVLQSTDTAGDLRHVFVQLRDGDWIVFKLKAHAGIVDFPLGPLALWATIGVVAIAVAWLSIWATRRLTAPLSRLAAAAENLGAGRAIPDLAEQGPLEVVRAARAFNEMQARIRRFIDDRTRMLTAISHDLRTPLTRLRLRIEADDIEPNSQRMLADVTALERMTNSALAFLRDQSEADHEKSISLDLAALLQTLCDDAADAGQDIVYDGLLHCIVVGRPDALARAFRNLLDNAHHHAGSALVRLFVPLGTPRLVRVEVIDMGPGISDIDKERVFDPFYRLDPARRTDSTGMGLGLAIVRSIIHAHGGDIRLLDNQPQGLIVWVHLPLRSSETEPRTAA